MFRRTVLPLTNSDIVKLGLKGRLESPSVNEDASIYIEGQMDSGFIGELTIGTQTYKGFLVKVDPNPVPPSVPRDTVTSLISPNSPIRDLGLGKGIPGYETLSYPPSLLSSAAFHPAPNFIPSPNMVPPPPPPSIPMDTEKKDKKRKKKDSKKDSDDEPKKKDKKKKKKKKTENNNGNVTSSKSTEKSNKEKSTSKKDEKDKNSTSNSTNKKSTTSNSSGGTVINVQNMMNRGGVPQPPSTNNNNSGWARDTSLSTKCMNCSQILLYPAGEKTVRCPSCKAILDVEHAESSVLRPCVGCSTMLGNPTNALKVLCPLCKTTMDWSKPPPSVQQMQAAADVKAQLKEKLASKSDAPVINLEEEKNTEKDTATSTTTSTSDSNSAPVAKENEEMAEADNEKANEDEKSNDESANDKETTNDKEESKATTTESNGKEPEKEVEAEKS